MADGFRIIQFCLLWSVPIGACIIAVLEVYWSRWHGSIVTLCYSFHHCLSWKRDWWTFRPFKLPVAACADGNCEKSSFISSQPWACEKSVLTYAVCSELTVSVAVGLDSVQGDQLLTVEVGNLCDRLLLLDASFNCLRGELFVNWIAASSILKRADSGR